MSVHDLTLGGAQTFRRGAYVDSSTLSVLNFYKSWARHNADARVPVGV